jgi:hypothetical protein
MTGSRLIITQRLYDFCHTFESLNEASIPKHMRLGCRRMDDGLLGVLI